MRHSISEMEHNCKRIKSNFNITFDVPSPARNMRPIGIHIRKTDRITQSKRKKGHVGDFTTPEESATAIDLATKTMLAKLPKQGVFIASDDQKASMQLSQTLRGAGIHILTPRVSPESVHPLFIDFFALSMCSEIWMLSSFSLFAIMAAKIGEVAPLYSLLPPNATNLQRYHLPTVLPFPLFETNHSIKSMSSWDLEIYPNQTVREDVVRLTDHSKTTSDNGTKQEQHAVTIFNNYWMDR